MSAKQLYEKTSEGMKEFSPLVTIEDIYARLSDTPLEALVTLYNHVKCEWRGTVADTRRTVPLFLRRGGLFITYNNGTKYITEFFSAGTDQITTEGWIKDSNWTLVPDEDYISAGVKPGVGSFGYEQLNDNLKQLFREKVNVTNYPDDEDIASVDNMLKFKDREVDAANFQSKGYVILRKNLCLVNGVVKNILTQDMINQPNTIYEIRYDFNLNGETIEMKEGCTLKFDGGRFKNGTLKGNKTTIYSPICTIFDLQLLLSGTYICDKAYPQWFGDVSANKDCTKNIQNCLDFFNKATITEDMMCKNLMVRNSLLEGIDKGMIYNNNNRSKLIAFSEYDIINTAENSNIYGLSFCGKTKKENAIVICNNTRIRNCSFSTLSSGIGAKGNYLHMDIFENCDFNNNNIALSNLVDSRITNCMFNANDTAILLQKGANANIISNCRIEWNVLGISLYQTYFNSITNNQFDRQAKEAININSCASIQIVANNFNRNGAENDRWNSKCHLAIISTNDILISGNKFGRGSSLNNGAGKTVPSNAFYLERCQVTLLGNYIKDGFVDSLYANFEGKLISKNNIGVDDDISEEYKDFVNKKIQPMEFVVLRQEGTIVKNSSIDFSFPVKTLSVYEHSQLMECILSSRNNTGVPYSIKIPFIITNEGSVGVSFSTKTILFSEEDIFNLSFVSCENNMLTLRLNNNSNFNANFTLSILKY